jgi:hypothetical protein
LDIPDDVRAIATVIAVFVAGFRCARVAMVQRPRLEIAEGGNRAEAWSAASIELDAQPGGEQMAAMGLVQVARRLGVLEQSGLGDHAPRRFARKIAGADHVRGDDVGVHERVAGAAGAVIERCRHHPADGTRRRVPPPWRTNTDWFS